MARPRTALVRLEEARTEWRALRRNPPATAELVKWMDAFMSDATVLIDSGRMVATIWGTEEMLHSETVRARFEEMEARRDFRRMSVG